MVSLPQPDDLTSLVLRTDFTDDTAWHALRAEIDSHDEYSHATFISEPMYDGVTVETLVGVDAAASGDDKLTYLFVADATTMTDGEHRLLAVDLSTEPGRTFRVPPSQFFEVSDNLSIANMDFDEFADATDQTGTYRGFRQS